MSDTPIVHRDLTLLQVETAEVLKEVRALADISDFVVGRLDERTLIVDPARTGELAARLATAGLSPLVRKLRPGTLPDATR